MTTQLQAAWSGILAGLGFAALMLLPRTGEACQISPETELLWPPDGATDVPANSRLWLYVGHPVAQEDLKLTDAEGAEVAFTLETSRGEWPATTGYTLIPEAPLTPGVLYRLSLYPAAPHTRDWSFTAGAATTSPVPRITDARFYEAYHPTTAGDDCEPFNRWDSRIQLFLETARGDLPLRYTVIYSQLAGEIQHYQLSWWERSTSRLDSFAAYVRTAHDPICVEVIAEDVLGQLSGVWTSCEPSACIRGVDTWKEAAWDVEAGWSDATLEICNPDFIAEIDTAAKPAEESALQPPKASDTDASASGSCSTITASRPLRWSWLVVALGLGLGMTTRRRHQRRRASLRRAASILGVMAGIAAVTMAPRPAEACITTSPSRLFWPPDGGTDVPANTRIWFTTQETLPSPEVGYRFVDQDGLPVSHRLEPGQAQWPYSRSYTLIPDAPLTPGVRYVLELVADPWTGEPVVWSFTAGEPSAVSPPHIKGARLYEGFFTEPMGDDCKNPSRWDTRLQTFLDIEQRMLPLRYQITYSALQGRDSARTLAWWETQTTRYYALEDYIETGPAPICVEVIAEDVLGQVSNVWTSCEPTGCARGLEVRGDPDYYDEADWADATVDMCDPEFVAPPDAPPAVPPSGCAVTATPSGSAAWWALGCLGLGAFTTARRRRRTRPQREPRKARSWSAAGLVLIGLVGAMTTTAPRPAEACSYDTSPELLWPLDGAADVPANTRIWIQMHEPPNPDNLRFLDANGTPVVFTIRMINPDGFPQFKYILTPQSPLVPGMTYTLDAFWESMLPAGSWRFTAGELELGPPPRLHTARFYEFFFERRGDDCAPGSRDTLIHIFPELERGSLPLIHRATFTGLTSSSGTLSWVWPEHEDQRHTTLATVALTDHRPICVELTVEDAVGRVSAPWSSCEPTACEPDGESYMNGEGRDEAFWADRTADACTPGASAADEEGSFAGCSVTSTSPSSRWAWLVVALGLGAWWWRRRLSA